MIPKIIEILNIYKMQEKSNKQRITVYVFMWKSESLYDLLLEISQYQWILKGRIWWFWAKFQYSTGERLLHLHLDILPSFSFVKK